MNRSCEHINQSVRPENCKRSGKNNMNFKEELLILAAAVFILENVIGPCEATSAGAPNQACYTLTPQHGTATRQPETGNPYRIQLGANLYEAGGHITVTLSGSQTGIKGFILQARRVGQSVPFGSWENLPTSAARTISCQGSDDSVTHSNNQLKGVVAFLWRAPATNIGTVEFVATVVQSFTTFWGPFKSEIATVGNVCSSNPCRNGGTCTSSRSTYRCTCQAGYTGVYCQSIGSQVCVSSPCLNGGTCITLNTNTYVCACRTGTQGNRCQNIVQSNSCSSNPCFNGGACTSFGSIYQCSCPVGYTGTRCQNIGDACSSNPCFNGGACTSFGSIYQCSCPVGYTGTRCQNTGNACSSNPCLNGGACISVGSIYQCSCPVGYTGTRCQNTGNACSSNPCLNGGACISVGSIYQCSCPVGYTGTRCQSTGNACSSNPCLNGGACISVGSIYQCSCPVGFTGTQCQSTGNACSSNPCFNGGACISVGSSYQCNCPVGFTGTQCQSTVFNGCSSNPCLNGGACTSFGSIYQCSCPVGFTGTQCQSTGNACSSNPCVNGGACISVGSSYQCNCPVGFTGTQCQSTVFNGCSSNPCLNGGACTSFGSAYQCNCPVGYTGTQCQNTVCSPNPCLNGAQCIRSSANTFSCVCRTGSAGPLCATIGNACSSSPCLNGGQCSLFGSSYQCLCPTGFTGTRCSSQISACVSNPCLNGGQCSLVTGTSIYQCSCPVGYSGTRCQNTACSSSPCLNGGQCSLIAGTTSYRCICSTGFSGATCQTTACSSNPCLNGGQCSALTGTSTYQCSCPMGYSGTRCQDTVCSSGPCWNGGQCSPITGTFNYQCSCLIGYTGTRCQTTACTSSPCLNAGQCALIAGTTSYECRCTTGYSGDNCQSYQCNCPDGFTGFTGENCYQPRDPCSPNPCQNGGVCSSPASSTFQCQCTSGWSGVDCTTLSQAVCEQASICLNGGTCQPNTGGSFICLCVEGFDGVDCSRQISPCLPSPCLNGGTCAVESGSSFTCSCPASHSGIICDIEDLCNPSPCNRGVCQQAAGTPSYTCSCNDGYSGTNCDVQALCTPNPCVNGICEQDDVALNYSCQCDPGFIGENCDQVREEACVTNPCLNGSTCVVLADKYSYECACLPGYQGPLCDEAIIPVFQDCPEFQILTFPLEPGQDAANVPLTITATVPGVEVTMEVVTGPDIPGIIPYVDEFRTGTPVVVRASSSTGATADCNFLLRMIDEEPPTVDCPQDITKVTYGSSEVVDWSPATASDNLARPVDMTITYSMENGSSFLASEEASPNIIEVTAMDTFDNVGACQFEVTVVKIPNAPLPVFIGCREGETVSYQLREHTDVAYVSINLQARDSSQQLAIITQLEGPDVSLPGDVVYTDAYREGQKFMFQALDPVTELASVCTFWIQIVDKEPPFITCPANIIERTTTDTKAIFWTPVNVEDNLALPDEDYLTSDPINGTVFDATANGLSYIVTMTATDSFSNVATCQFSVTLYQFDIVCSEFPTVVNGSGDCVIAANGKMECRVSCDMGYEYAPEDDRFKCQITSTKAYWDPLPNTDACIRPTAGTAISKTVTTVFPFDASVCDDGNRAFISTIQTSIQSSLEMADLCERGAARACTPGSVTPKCGVVAGAGTRKRRAFTDLTVDIEVTAPAADTQGSSLTQVKQDVDDLAGGIQDHADEKLLTLTIDHEEVHSLTSQISQGYTWICQDGYKSVTGGCVPCPPGTYLNSSTLQCMFCEQGNYQVLSGQTTCAQCAPGRSTDQIGSLNIRQCLSLGATAALTWSPFLTSMVIIVIVLFLGLFIGIFCICCCVPKKERHYGRGKDADGSLSNLKYLNKAYEEEYTKRQSVGIHRLGKHQTSPSRASTATGYITTSTAGSSHNHVDMVSIDSDDYHEGAHGKQSHYNHGNTVKRDSGISYGHVSTATLASSGDGFNSPPKQQGAVSDPQMRRELPDTGL